MSLVHVANAASHLQNACKAKLSITSIPMTKQLLSLMLAMQRQGIISTVDVGGQTPPRNLLPTEINFDHTVLGGQTYDPLSLSEKPWLAYPDPKFKSLSSKFTSQIPPEQADRRIWVGLKYWNDKPVMNRIDLVSRAKKPIALGYRELAYLTRGLKVARVLPLVNPGECMFVRTSEGLFESRECVEKKLGGQVLCRVE